MPYIVGIAVWLLAGVASTLLGGEFMSGQVFVFGGLAAAVVAGLVSAMTSKTD